MSLLDRVKSLTESLAELEIRRAQADNLKIYEQRRDQLQDPVIKIRKLAHLANAMKGRGIKPQIETSKLQPILTKSREIARAFKEKRESLVQANRDNSNKFWQPLPKFPEPISASLSQAWTEYIDGKIMGIQQDVLSVLSKVPGFEGQTAKVLQPLQALQSLRTKLPDKNIDFDRIDSLSKELHSAWQSLGGEGIPREVLDFLKSAHSDGVTLDQLNASVMDWLAVKGLKNKYIVKAMGRYL